MGKLFFIFKLMKSILTLVLSIFVITCSSQGDKELLGLDVSSHVTYDKIGDLTFESRLATDIGFHYEVDAGEYMFVQLGASFMDVGYKVTYGATEGALGFKYTEFIHNYYISAPVNLFVKASKLWVGVGLNLNYYINTRQKDPLNNVTYKDKDLRSFLVGINISAGIREKITNGIYYHLYAYLKPLYSLRNSVNYGLNAGISFDLYPEAE